MPVDPDDESGRDHDRGSDWLATETPTGGRGRHRHERVRRVNPSETVGRVIGHVNPSETVGRVIGHVNPSETVEGAIDA